MKLFMLTDYVIVSKTNNDVEGFNRYLNKYLNSAHPTIFKFIDHLKIIERLLFVYVEGCC